MQLACVVQDVAQVGRHHQLHQTLQVVVLQTGTASFMDTLGQRHDIGPLSFINFILKFAFICFTSRQLNLETHKKDGKKYF